jgi:shikimate dehydrogenase
MRTLQAALIGRSLSHSISAEVHREIFPYACPPAMRDSFDGVDYRLIECSDVAAFLNEVRHGMLKGLRGYNVTFPYKDVASRLQGEIDPLVRDIHSANTIVFVAGGFRVFSTDGPGLRESLRKELPRLNASKYRLVIVGAGGAGRAVLNSLYHMGWGSITACARSIPHANLAFAHYGTIEMQPIDRLRAAPLPSLIVQATPVGQRSHDALLQHYQWTPQDIAVDLVYNPLRTRFLDIAAAGGAKVVSGLGMLIEQAALSQYIWIKEKPHKGSLLSAKHYQELFERLSHFVQPRWDVSAT